MADLQTILIPYTMFSVQIPCTQKAHIVRRSDRWMSEYNFTSFSAQSWQYRDRKNPEAVIDSTVHSMPLNSLEHCICTTTMTNIRPDRDSSLVHPGYKPQSIWMSHRGRPVKKGEKWWNILIFVWFEINFFLNLHVLNTHFVHNNSDSIG